MCPCWTDDEPDDGHCTGLFAWSVDTGSTIDGLQVGGARVVCVTTHLGRRRGQAAEENTLSVIFVDVVDLPEDKRAGAFTALGQAFSGDRSGPLEDLKGQRHGRPGRAGGHRDHGDRRQRDRHGRPAAARSPSWSTLSPAAFDGHPPLTLRRTALSKELGIADEETVTAHHSGTLTIRAAVPAGRAHRGHRALRHAGPVPLRASKNARDRAGRRAPAPAPSSCRSPPLRRVGRARPAVLPQRTRPRATSARRRAGR